MKENKVTNIEMEMSNVNGKVDNNNNNNTMESFNIRVKHIINDWALNSKTHGLSNMVRNPKFILKTFWLLCFLCSSGYCN